MHKTPPATQYFVCNIYNCFGKSPKVCRWQLRIQNQQRRTDGGYYTANRVRKLGKRHREAHGNPVWTASPSLEAVFCRQCDLWITGIPTVPQRAEGSFGSVRQARAGIGRRAKPPSAYMRAAWLWSLPVSGIGGVKKGHPVHPYRHRGSRWKLTGRMVWSGVRGRICKAARNTLRITVNASAFRIGA